MQIHALELDDCYNLIGIHTSEEDYKLAYLLNRNLNTSFKRFKHDLDFKDKSASFTVFDFSDDINQLDSYLITNKFTENFSPATNSNLELFSNDVLFSTMSYLIPEKKNVDYFLKIEGEITTFELGKLIKQINNIPQIVASYNINPFTLKSKDYLIF